MTIYAIQYREDSYIALPTLYTHEDNSPMTFDDYKKALSYSKELSSKFELDYTVMIFQR